MKGIILIFCYLLFAICSFSQHHPLYRSWDVGTPPIDAIIAAWELDETTGNTCYDSENSNNLTVVNALINQTGKINKAVSFDGNVDYLEIADNSPLSITGALSIELWFYTSQASNNNEGLIAKSANVSPWLAQRSYATYIKDGDSRSRALGFALSGDGNYSSAYTLETGVNVFSFNSWVHAVFVFDPNNYMKIYVNGSQVATKTISLGALYDSTAPLWIGSQYHLIYNAVSNVFFNGKMDMVRIRNFALSATQITTLYNNGDGLSYSQLTF